jgi:hypothetical protein
MKNVRDTILKPELFHDILSVISLVLQKFCKLNPTPQSEIQLQLLLTSLQILHYYHLVYDYTKVTGRTVLATTF